MQVILLEKIRNLGDLGETVKVKSGFGRNFLIPHGRAVFASKQNEIVFEERRTELEKKEQDKLTLANERAAKLALLDLNIETLASDEGKLYGSIGLNEIAKLITDAGVEVSRKEVVMSLGSIHYLGEHSIDVQLHSDVMATLTVTVFSSEAKKEEDE
jgi:large subunit ribosomal protein L9